MAAMLAGDIGHHAWWSSCADQSNVAQGSALIVSPSFVALADNFEINIAYLLW